MYVTYYRYDYGCWTSNWHCKFNWSIIHFLLKCLSTITINRAIIAPNQHLLPLYQYCQVNVLMSTVANLQKVKIFSDNNFRGFENLQALCRVKKKQFQGYNFSCYTFHLQKELKLVHRKNEYNYRISYRHEKYFI